MENVTLIVAFLAGISTFFSPCVLPLIPAYISMIIGSTNISSVKRGELLIRTIFFICGFGLIFVILGLGATWIGAYLSENIMFFKKIAGIVIIIMGLFLMGLINFETLERTKQLKFHIRASYGGNFLLGLTFGFAWTPCVGPILGSILVLASTSGRVISGLWLLLAYTMGLSLPFMIIALVGERMIEKFRLFVKSSEKLKILAAVVIVILGLLIMTNKI